MFDYEEFLKNEDFPQIEALVAQSSNIEKDIAFGYAITKVKRTSWENRAEALKKLIELGVKKETSIVKGYVWSDSNKVTIPDEVVMQCKDKNVRNEDQFEVIWLGAFCVEKAYNGNAGHEVHKFFGFVLRYPDEMKKAS